MTTTSQTPVAMTIAGSEATGGAGALADIKTFQALGVYGCLSLTCIVSFDPKNDWGHRVLPIDQQTLADQLEVNTTAYDLDAVKIGMLGSPDTIDTVSATLRRQSPKNIVLDPVLICKGQEPGAALDTDKALTSKILPLADFVTPNHFESLSLSGMDRINDVADLEEAARRIHERSGAAVLAKGGVRIEGPDAVDVFYAGETTE
ncbi:MAG: bifunctional hydroxymethylpyrimidine kinase/phosphomethylpyrimidine kinase, partial [Kocuria sp.]|nr:bifunctional hydroxymethylpyrimidine kinase/phosphomethylpyrimidine kinase [Kocuria sp.]